MSDASTIDTGSGADSVERAPVGQAPAEPVQAGPAPAGQAPVAQAQVVQAQVAQAPAEQTSAEPAPSGPAHSDGAAAVDREAAERAAAEQAAAARAAWRDRTGRDMLLALASLLVPILLIGGLLRACGSAAPTVVDPTPQIDNARAAGLFTVLVPHGLDEGWRPVQATFGRENETVGTLRLGYLTPSGGQLLLVESNADVSVLLASELGDEVRPDGEVMVAGRAWTRSVVRGDERSLVLVESDRIIVIVGRAPADEMTELAGSLR